MKDNGELRNISRLDDSKREDTLQFQSQVLDSNVVIEFDDEIG